jgi:hypothetical protein
MSKYAQDTNLSPGLSRAEIERTLERYGADAFAYGWKGVRAVISFEYDARRYRIILPLPNKNEFAHTETGRNRTSQQAITDAYDQACRQRWRALALWIKATLEASEAGITTLEEAMQSSILLPNGQTVGEWMEDQISKAYQTGRMPPMMLGLPEGESEEGNG